MTFEDLQKANESISATRLENKKTGEYIGDYVEVNQRIKAFRMLFPEGTIETTMLSNENGVCVFKASIYAFKGKDMEEKEQLLGTGTAYEKENSTFINKTSYIENCETSAVGRALAMCGIGIDKSVASAEEVQNAVVNQLDALTKEDAENYVITFGKYNGKKLSEVIKDEWYKNYLLNGDNDYIKKCIELITGEVMPGEEEQQERLNLINEIMDLVDKTNTDYEGMLKHYGVGSNIEMTTEQLRDAKEVLEKKL